MEHRFNLIQGDAGSEPDAVPGGVVTVVDGFETTGQLNGLAGLEHKDRTDGPTAYYAFEKSVVG